MDFSHLKLFYVPQLASFLFHSMLCDWISNLDSHFALSYTIVHVFYVNTYSFSFNIFFLFLSSSLSRT